MICVLKVCIPPSSPQAVCITQRPLGELHLLRDSHFGDSDQSEISKEAMHV